MNRIKCIKILSGLLGVFLLLSFFPLVDSQPISANPDRLEWSVVATPSEENGTVLPGSDITGYAVSAANTSTIYAIGTYGQPHLWKSKDGGATWQDRAENVWDADDLPDEFKDTVNETFAENVTFNYVACAQDDSDFVAVALVDDNGTATPGLPSDYCDDTQAVVISNDGGDNFAWTGVISEGGATLNCTFDMKISNEDSDGNRNIALGGVGTNATGACPTGLVFRYVTGGLTSGHWVDASAYAGWDDSGDNSVAVTKVAFAPSWLADNTVLALSHSATNTYLQSGTWGNTKVWNGAGDFEPAVEITGADGGLWAAYKGAAAGLALPTDYENSRNFRYAWVYVDNTNTTTGGVIYRVKNGQVDKVARQITGNPYLASISYQGTIDSGKVVVGLLNGTSDHGCPIVLVYRNNVISMDMPISKPTPTEASKPPTGGGVALVQFAAATGSKVYAATSGNESAFSVSFDGGDTWNQLGLIDTEMTFLCDYAFSADNDILYLASINNQTPSSDSIWRTNETKKKTPRWQRVLCLDGEDNIILRPTPEWEEKEQIYFAVPETDNVKYSENEGQSWEKVWECPDVTDLAVVSDKLLYILDDDVLNKCSWNETLWEGIWEWERDIDTGLDSGSAVFAYGTNYVFVSENGGKSRIAYSSDGGEMFNVTESLPEPGEIQLTVDDEFNSNKFIYAASAAGSSDIYRWAIGASTSWKEMNTPPGMGGFHGLAQIDEVLYGAHSDGVARTLTPHLETIRVTDWDYIETGLEPNVTFKSRSLKAISNEDVELWAIDRENYDFSKDKGCLWVYTDAFVLETPWPNTPALKESLPCEKCTCRAEDFCFRWRMLPSTEKYDLWIALDEDFTAIIHQEGNIIPDAPCSPAWCPSSSAVQFVCGETYFWKVRSCESTEGERIRSRWSPTMKFTVKECSAREGEVYLAPILLVPDIGSKNVRRSPTFSWEGFPPTTEYEFTLANDDALTLVIVNEKVSTSTYQYKGSLDWNTTYYWQVRGIEPTLSEPALGVFTVMTAPEPTPATPPTPLWVWAIIGILAFLDVVVITFCMIKR